MVTADDQLLEAWRGGDRDAGDKLIARHFPSLYRFFATKLSAGSAEDLVQRTLLDCVESKDRVASGNFRAYLFGVARNRLVDHLRHKLRGGDAVDILEMSLADLGTSPSEAVARSQEEQLIVRAMQALPLDLQITLELAYWEGLSGREIAAVLNIPDNTVRSRLARARAQLRGEIERLARTPQLARSTLRRLDARVA